jgi:hypothetical protein
MSENSSDESLTRTSNKHGANGSRSPLVSAIVAGAIVFVFGTPVLAGTILLVVSWFSMSLYSNLVGRTPGNPNWKPWWGYWFFQVGIPVVGLLLAIVIGRLWFKKESR